METSKRGQWGSSFGFLMAAIGSAIGLGNLWAFPYKMGKTGGFAFLVLYLILVALVGVVGMLGEFALGRKTGKGAGGAYAALGKKYSFIGWMAVISPFLILSFYAVLGGMVLRYCLGFLVQIFGADGFAGQGSGFFGWLLYSGQSMILFFALFLVCTMAIVMGGVQGGIEKFSKAVMPALGVILIGIIIFVAMQPGALEGYKFMFKPDMSLFSSPGSFFDVLKTASGQVFFSLSMAMGINITFGSYLDKQKSLQKNAVIVPLFDTIFAVLAGMMILPACAAFHVDYAQGPGLLFASMQKVFLDGMGGQAGNIIGFLFYFLVFIAAVTSSIALMEVLTSAVVDRQLDKGTGAQPQEDGPRLRRPPVPHRHPRGPGRPGQWRRPGQGPLRAAGPDDRERRLRHVERLLAGLLRHAHRGHYDAPRGPAHELAHGLGIPQPGQGRVRAERASI